MQLLLPGSGNSSSPGLRQDSIQTLAVTPGYQAPCSSRRSPSCLFQQETDGAEGHDPAPRADSSQRMKVSIGVLECSCWRDGGTSQQSFASYFLLLLFLTRSEPNQTQFLFSWEKKSWNWVKFQGKHKHVRKQQQLLSHNNDFLSRTSSDFSNPEEVPQTEGERGILALHPDFLPSLPVSDPSESQPGFSKAAEPSLLGSSTRPQDPGEQRQRLLALETWSCSGAAL